MRVAEGVYSIGQKKGGRVHAYLFDHGDELTLVDTLFDTDARLVLDCIRRIGRSPRDLKRIALTHGHRSHLGGLARLRELSGALVYAHEWEADIIAGERAAQPVSLQPGGPLSTYPFRIGLALGRPRHRPCPVDRSVTEGDEIGPLQVLHIPGHTPGHLAFHYGPRGVLAVGDAVATWPRTDAGWPGFNLNEGQYRVSLRRLAQVEGAIIAVGHGEPLIEGAADRVYELAEGLPPSAPSPRG
jgi:glyoxylase-like metal-dependent hydrolase (beta-lactamase superfamily II)